jgi:hypothetical protein
MERKSLNDSGGYKLARQVGVPGGTVGHLNTGLKYVTIPFDKSDADLFIHTCGKASTDHIVLK